VVELWTLAAEDLFAANDVGVIPWVPLTQYQGPPETLLEQCRQRIEEQARPDQQTNLLAVSQVLAGLRFSDPELLAILGGKRVMIESPVIKELLAEKRAETQQQAVGVVLEGRFGEVPQDITKRLRRIRSEKRLTDLIRYASRCPDLEAFRTELFS
jgi:predicted transposase YdaD